MNRYKQPQESGMSVTRIVTFCVIAFVVVVAGGMTGCPAYNVWIKEMDGRAKLAEAEQSRRIAVLEAQAKMDSAKMLSDAEVQRARGVAEANKIIGDSLAGNESYLRYLWIQNLSSGEGREVVYVPTEAGLPILEAGRLK